MTKHNIYSKMKEMDTVAWIIFFKNNSNMDYDEARELFENTREAFGAKTIMEILSKYNIEIPKSFTESYSEKVFKELMNYVIENSHIEILKELVKEFEKNYKLIMSIKI